VIAGITEPRGAVEAGNDAACSLWSRQNTRIREHQNPEKAILKKKCSQKKEEKKK
jgi:hypothetical protein